MKPDEFVNAIRQVVYESAINGTLHLITKPPGRSPQANLSALSKWFGGLSEDEKIFLQQTISIAVHQATFGMLAVLDGVRQIEDSQKKGILELHYLKENEDTLLNAPNEEALHDLFNQGGTPY